MREIPTPPRCLAPPLPPLPQLPRLPRLPLTLLTPRPSMLPKWPLAALEQRLGLRLKSLLVPKLTTKLRVPLGTPGQLACRHEWRWPVAVDQLSRTALTSPAY